MKKKDRKQTETLLTKKNLLMWGAVCAAIIVIGSIALIAFYSTDEANRGLENYVGFGADFNLDSPSLPPRLDTTTVATINGYPITAQDVGYHLLVAWGENPHEIAARQAALPIMFSQFAAQHGLYVSDEEMDDIREEIGNIAAGMSPAEFDQLLISDGIQSTAHLEQLFYNYAITDIVVQTILADLSLFAYFEQYMPPEPETDIAGEELLAAQHILIADEDLAYEVLQRALAGEDFSTLVATYGQDPGQPPEGYTFVSGVMVYDFEEATRHLQIGEISGLVPSEFGVHIIKRVEPNPDDVMLPFFTQEEPLDFHQRRIAGIHRGFEAKVAAAELIFLPELYQISLH